ncbi:MAG: hypothetical protein V1678_01675 [Candidatus Aenigmatarchaeota archaeon]
MKSKHDPKLLTFFMPENQFICEYKNIINTEDIKEDYSIRGGALTMFAGLNDIPSQDYKLYWDDRGIVQRVERYQPMNPFIMSEQMKYDSKPFPIDLSPFIEVVRVLEKEGAVMRFEGREYVKVYPNERAVKIDLGIKGLQDIEDEHKLVSDIIQKMYDPEEYWVVDSVIQMREMGSLEKFKMPQSAFNESVRKLETKKNAAQFLKENR